MGPSRCGNGQTRDTASLTDIARTTIAHGRLPDARCLVVDEMLADPYSSSARLLMR